MRLFVYCIIIIEPINYAIDNLTDKKDSLWKKK